MCLMAGRTLTPEIASTCNRCALYLCTCLPIVTDTGLVAGECDDIDYCMECVVYEDCCQITNNGGTNNVKY